MWISKIKNLLFGFGYLWVFNRKIVIEGWWWSVIGCLDICVFLDVLKSNCWDLYWYIYVYEKMYLLFFRLVFFDEEKFFFDLFFF